MKEGWEIKKLGEVCDIICGRSQKAVVCPDGSYPIYGSGGIMGYASDYLCEAGATIIGRKGSINNPIYVNTRFWNVDTAFGILPKEILNPKLFYYFCKSFDFSKLNKGTTIPSLVKKDILQVGVPYNPSLSEQQRIVDILDKEFEKIDRLRSNAEQNLKNAKDLFQAILKKELEPKEGWTTMKLGEFAHMKAGDFIRASDIHDSYYDGSFPCYGGNGLRGYVDIPNKSGEYCLIGRQGALCGNIHIVNGTFRATEHAVVVSPHLTIPTRLVYYLLVSLNLNKYSTGAAQPGLSVKNIAEKASISIPPKNEWDGILDSLDRLLTQTTTLQDNFTKTIALCDDLKQSLLRKAFNGEL